MADALDVQAARGNVGRDQDVDLAVLELLDGALALRCWMSPLMAAAEKPRACSLLASSSVPSLVREKMIMPSKFSASRMRVSASSLCMPDTSQ
jgi:hypothetical protein